MNYCDAMDAYTSSEEIMARATAYYGECRGSLFLLPIFGYNRKRGEYGLISFYIICEQHCVGLNLTKDSKLEQVS